MPVCRTGTYRHKKTLISVMIYSAVAVEYIIWLLVGRCM